MSFGRHGTYLRIDVATGVAEPIAIPEDVFLRYLGGVGLGAWICLREGGAEQDPLAPESPLVFCMSPLVGTPLTTSAKFAVVARSPLTGFLSDAISSSHFAIAAKRAGFDAYVLTGRAPRLSRLLVDNGQVKLTDGDALRGLPAHECELDGFRTAAIGLAGENLVRFATISNDGRHAGRGGLGAVMGAKNIKAFSVRGDAEVEVADPRGVVALARDLSEKSLGPATAKYRELGTIANVLVFNRLRTLPTRNFQDGTFEGAPSISAEALHAMDRIGRASCAACTIGCEHFFRAPDGLPVRLEYETLFALGSLLGISDRAVVLEAAQRCDHLGIDTISAGGTIAFAMEAGLSGLSFGDAAGVRTALDEIGRGGELAQGSRRVAESIGRPELAMHVKGLEMPGYDPRRLSAMGLGLAVSTRGADHNRSSAYELDFSAEASTKEFDVGQLVEIEKIVELEDRAAALDSLILCKFLRGVFSDFWGEASEMVRLVTGESTDIAVLGSRVCSLRKEFNVRCGWTRADDGLPARLLDGALSPTTLADMIGAYYEARCWTKQGRVPPSLASRLKLSV